MATQKLKNKPAKSTDLSEFITKLKAKVNKDYDDSQQYRAKLANAYNQRAGNVCDTDYPWPGAPNVSMPFTDKLIRKRIPPKVLSVWNANQMAKVQVQEGIEDQDGLLKEKAKKAEKVLNMFLRNDENLLEQLTFAANYTEEKGRTYFYVYLSCITEYENKTLHIKSITNSINAQRQNLINKIAKETGQDISQVDPNQLPPQMKDALVTGEDTISALKTMKESELIQMLGDKQELGFNRENKQNVKEMKRVIKQFKKGVESIDYSLERVELKPVIEAVKPDNITVPRRTKKDIQSSYRVAYDFWWNEEQLWSAVESGQFDKEVVKDMINSHRSGTRDFATPPVDYQEEIDEGVFGDDATSGSYHIKQVHTYYKNDTKMEKWVLTYFVEDTKATYLRFIKEPTPKSKYPFVEHDNELRDDRAYNSRGTPEMIKDVQTTIDREQNNRMARDEVQNTPMFTVRKSANINARAIKFIPGQGIEVDNPNDITFWNPVKQVDIMSERIEAQQKSYGEELMGDIDFAFGRAGNVAGGGGAKTLGEIQVAQSEGNKLASLDLLLWHRSISKVFTLYFEILADNLDPDKKIVIEDEIITVEDFNFPYDVRSNGQIEDSDKVFKAQKALANYQITLQAPQDMVTPEDRYNALKDYHQAQGVQTPDRYTTNPLEIMKDKTIQAQQQLQQLQQQAVMITEELEKKEQELAVVEEKNRRVKNKFSAKTKLGEEKKVTETRERSE